MSRVTTYDQGRIVHVGASGDQVGAAVGQLVADLSKASIAASGRFTLALSGGSLPKILEKGLASLKGDLDFSKWHVFFADERCVPLEHSDSNYLACHDAFFQHVPIPRAQIHTIVLDSDPAVVATEYTRQLASLWGSTLPRFDLILLGMGPDGHTCSLFPGHPLLNEESLWVAPISDSPKPPPQRITLTYPVVNNAAAVAFVATGDSKAPLMRHMLGLEIQTPSLPAARILPTNGQLHWFLDDAAASKL
ncbi:6-phosphogluconolactonase [Saprolegnia parasitica CBS 223.65]|uniref:6-phosphogluconolactonase n=1 Tax=Saprolegnia parasitica (strain CBS 223.65) TaxID=695850 RepID=A0A067C9C3_SAPPC|nr:6-phosphogluconolactonase [Saprolegnia parasitica CBS 223.65]KDO27369.1 6-phosphogluconolactonase [Saprolegnia parasitica CBS 223.65]|eukprot:XP_012201810.1 6-phosphogluconolactonase [Saprolegnia parasitica CBS 223.65]